MVRFRLPDNCAMTLDFVLSDSIKIPFSNFDLYQGVDPTSSLKADVQGLTVEFEVIEHDLVWMKSKTPAQELRISFDETESVALKQG